MLSRPLVGIPTLLLSVVLPATTATVPVVAAPKSAVPPTVRLVPVDWVGTGCNSSNTKAELVDTNLVTITYQAFAASAPGPIAGRKSTCRVFFRLEYPKGYTFSIIQASYSLGVKVGATAEAAMESTFSFSGPVESGHVTKVWNGPFNDVDRLVQVLDKPIYLPCGGARDLYVDTRLAATAGSSGESSHIGVSALDTSVKTGVHIDWDECP